jgi:DNA-directed RNA polymerase specialized sigma24 family protein
VPRKPERKAERQRQYEAEFGEFLAYRYALLLRFGYLLTGDLGAAEDLLDRVLAGTYRQWRSLRIVGAEQVARKEILALVLSAWWRDLLTRVTGWQGSRAGAIRAELPDLAVDTETELDEIWARLTDLRPRQRALVVLRYDENLSIETISELIGSAPNRVVRELAEAVKELEVAG